MRSRRAAFLRMIPEVVFWLPHVPKHTFTCPHPAQPLEHTRQVHMNIHRKERVIVILSRIMESWKPLNKKLLSHRETG